MVDAPVDVDCDLAVIGDGPAGTALAAASVALGLRTVLIGGGDAWGATYGMWHDEVRDCALWASLGDAMFTAIDHEVVAYGSRRHRLGRSYALMDNEAVRRHLRHGVETVTGRVTRITSGGPVVEVHGEAGVLSARWAVDATGAGSTLLGAQSRRPTAWQTAYGVVLERMPESALVDADQTVLMDFRPLDGPECAVGTFCYVVRVADGWLVEETVLSASPAVGLEVLRERLITRLGGDAAVVDSAVRTERVSIPMDAPTAAPPPRTSVFGAAAGYIHPATGFSVSASVRAAQRVAAALATAVDGGPDPMRAVWTRPMRATRRLHRYGAGVLAGLDAEQTRCFFDVFFDRPASRWAPYLAIDAPPAAVMSTMAGLFASAPWSLRRSLMTVDPRRWMW
jgi:lycopene beta-cyclase